MNASVFVDKAVDIAKNHNTVYMWGVFGAPVTESVIAGKTKQYPSWYTDAKQSLFRGLIGKNYFGFDCVCLIKGILWGWDGDNSKSYGGAKYASNGVPDIGADQMIKVCSGVTTDFSGIVPGAAVWTTGHIGIYIGDGLAVECTPKWKNCVQITAVGNIGTVAGYNTRTWKKWGKLPYINYEAEQPKKEEVEVTQEQFDKLMADWLARREQEAAADWSEDARKWAEENGIIYGDGSGKKMYKAFATREHMIVFLYRLAEKLGLVK